MPQQIFRQALYLLLFFALLMVYIGRYTDIDLRLADAMFHTADRVFP